MSTSTSPFHYVTSDPAYIGDEGDGKSLLFSYFRDNGVEGVFLCTSKDGIHFRALNDAKPIFTPPYWPGQNLTRDPCIHYRDGLFRMVWTSGWVGRVFGYAESPDLVHWSEPRQVRPFPDSLPQIDQPDNIWAPKLHWDPINEEFFILFSCTTERERTNGDGSDNNGDNSSQYDNRIYITRTKDGRVFSDAQLFFDQGFACIDAVMRIDEQNQRWVMVVKCSRNWALPRFSGRNLRVTHTGLDLYHPSFAPISAPIAGNHSPMFSNPEPPKSMAEGPSLLRYKGQWFLYWDEPAGAGLQLGISSDLVTWMHRKDLTMPARAQHGTGFFAPVNAVGWLRPRDEDNGHRPASGELENP